ncbi:MAG TPA: hypothetical protein VKK81_16020 [Candidatus Binatia bacterium]|nr:hypothetical protein [Candidatus Binatia bacterium]
MKLVLLTLIVPFLPALLFGLAGGPWTCFTLALPALVTGLHISQRFRRTNHVCPNWLLYATAFPFWTVEVYFALAGVLYGCGVLGPYDAGLAGTRLITVAELMLSRLPVGMVCAILGLMIGIPYAFMAAALTAMGTATVIRIQKLLKQEVPSGN